MNSTLACGYSPAENLIRLQRSLKGPALEAVRSRLLLPESVPHIIDTLRLLYGRPELLINALIEKVHSVPTPKAEKLESLIDFGMAVQSLCDHLEAANQQAHLSNPSLLIELVDKLPVHMKMEWVKYMENNQKVDLKVFGEFMRGVVKSASQVTLYSGMANKVKKGEVEDKWKQKRAAVNSHTLESPRQSGGECTERPCAACRQMNHRLKECGVFKSYSVEGRCRFVQQHGICRNCLNAHGRRACRNPGVCGVNGCQYRHHPLLHFARANVPRMTMVENHVHREVEPSLYFRIIPVTICGGGNSVATFAFLDDGSQLTLIEEGLVRQLGVEGMESPLCLKWTGNMARTENGSQTVRLSIVAENQRHFPLAEVRTVKALSLPCQSLNASRLANKYTHLRRIPVSSYSEAVPRLLVGVDNLRLTVPLKTKEGRVNEPIAVKTRLGWCIYGGRARSTEASLNYHSCECSSDHKIHDLVKGFFDAETVGTSTGPSLMSEDDRRASNLLETTARKIGSRFEIGLLWRFDKFKLPDSYGMAMKRLECLERRMARQPDLKSNVVKQIDEYLLKGYINRITQEELEQADAERVWYLPLGVVLNPKKPNKIRMIWDAAAKSHGVSLNDMLLKGPDQLTSLPGVLFRFRQFAVAVSADIAEMFHQIIIRAEDRHAQRFLWRNNSTAVPEVFLMNVATFGSTCSPASAQFIKNKNAMEFAQEYPRAVQSIIKNHYVDDLLESFEDAEEAAKVMQEVQMIHANGGFNIRKFQSNSRLVMDSVGEDRASDVRSLDLPQSDNSERVLGLIWNSFEDLLGFSTKMSDDIQRVISTRTPPTKRQVLKCLMSFYDPLGLLAIFTVQGKIILQSIWRSGIQWDHQINANLQPRWQAWVELLKIIQQLRITRCYFLRATSQHYYRVQLHIFVDASEEAYAAVAYFRIVNQRKHVDCSLVAAKTKVAPIKPISVPRLELQAAVLGVRLMQMVADGHSIQIDRRVFWSDSSTVLAWINSDNRRYKQFVAVRVGEILTETNAGEWRYVPSKKNIADAATKWGNGPDFGPNSAWFNGPEFLRNSEEEWPIAPCLKEDNSEVRAVYIHQEQSMPKLVLNLERFSNWNRLLRTTAYLYRFLNRTRKRDIAKPYLSQEELVEAWQYLIKATQWEVYPDELAVLTHKLHQPSDVLSAVDKSSSLYQLSPMVDELGILRVDSRIQAAEHLHSQDHSAT
ncbi:uncharacterized protein LOC134209180 [Armigeres subalbatus]|uniref:uncharacterized protein LOC134209180 n=1 Tax=Armigeres subalbatus TaxID=124917 RepID=UPI002ED6068F